MIALDFYLLPLLISDTGMAMILSLVAMPLICLGCATVYGAKNGFSLLFCALVAMLYASTLPIFYNSSAWIYIVCYGLAAAVGNAAGRAFFCA
ncbi:MAG: hypothetical protein RR893_08160 [Clostridia bacterium]